ncbi:MAG TPA: VOC family protein [Candidatus Elarobacter sp.]|jgi:catechol 2,3-dioxygenase-like lactoylglutathione lyase family enzyme
MPFLGIDHIDLRVPALGAVEAFYDKLFARLGLTKKKYSVVAFGGESWNDGTAENYNAVEWYEEHVHGRRVAFFGVIEESGSVPAHGRIAFAVEKESLDEWARVLREMGAREIERCEDDAYPAVFFTDPLGTRLEVCARPPRP